MIISFVLALVVFSVIMTVVCVSIYQNSIGVREAKEEKQISTSLPNQTCRYEFSETVLYYAEDEAAQLRYAVLVGIDTQHSLITLTPISASLPVSYKGGIYRVSSIYKDGGREALPELIYALTGIEPSYERDAATLSFLSSDSLGEFYDTIKKVELESHEGYSVVPLDIVLDEKGIADNQKTIEQFFTVENQ